MNQDFSGFHVLTWNPIQCTLPLSANQPAGLARDPAQEPPMLAVLILPPLFAGAPLLTTLAVPLAIARGVRRAAR